MERRSNLKEKQSFSSFHTFKVAKPTLYKILMQIVWFLNIDELFFEISSTYNLKIGHQKE